MNDNLTMKDLPVRERPYERAEKLGIDALSEAELIAIIIKTGKTGSTALSLAHRVLASAGGLADLMEMSQEDLKRVPGIGRVKALQILAGLELGQRASAARASLERPRIHGPDDIIGYVEAHMRYRPREQFAVVLLDTRHRIIRHVVISSGGLSSSVIQPRDIFHEAVRANAAAVILVHNHPSGDPFPSRADQDSTKKIVELGDALGVPVLDHIIVASESTLSMRECNLFPV